MNGHLRRDGGDLVFDARGAPESAHEGGLPAPRLAYVHLGAIPREASANAVHVVKMCQAFARCGADVTLLAPPGTANPGADLYDYYGVEPNFRFLPVPLHGRPGAFHRFALAAIRRARRLRVGCVYTRSHFAAFYARLFDLPVTLELHSPDMGRALLGRIIAHRVVNNPQVRIVTISQALRRELNRLYGRPVSAMLVEHDAADPEPTGEGPSYRLSSSDADQPLKVGYVGQLYPGKGMELIAAMAPLCPWAEFHVVGGTAEQVTHWASRTGGVNNLRLHGNVPPHQTGRYRQQMDVLVAPYQSRVSVQGGLEVGSWMSPLKLFEYMASRRPIVCSDLPVLREILTDDATALLVPPQSVEGWVRALERLRAPQLRYRLAEGAHRQFLLHHTWHARARRLLDGWPYGGAAAHDS